MSFDLFLVAPTFDRMLAERFNAFRHPGVPEGLHIDPAQCADDSTLWQIRQDGEEWLEIYIDRHPAARGAPRPAGVGADWVEVHVPSHGDPTVFHTVAALAELSQGWVIDPQGVASMESYDAGAAQADNAARGFYTPDVARGIAGLLATRYRWD